MHNPPCESWEQHVELAYAALTDGDDYDLNAFTDFLLHTWQDEQIVADPESPAIYEEQRAVVADWPLKWDDIKRAKGAA